MSVLQAMCREYSRNSCYAKYITRNVGTGPRLCDNKERLDGLFLAIYPFLAYNYCPKEILKIKRERMSSFKLAILLVAECFSLTFVRKHSDLFVTAILHCRSSQGVASLIWDRFLSRFMKPGHTTLGGGKTISSFCDIVSMDGKRTTCRNIFWKWVNERGLHSVFDMSKSARATKRIKYVVRGPGNGDAEATAGRRPVVEATIVLV